MPVRVIDLSAASHPSDANQGHISPQSCTLLSVGQAFSGTQNVSNLQKDEAWRVNVRIQGCDLDHGYLCGTMETLNVPMADTPEWFEVLAQRKRKPTVHPKNQESRIGKEISKHYSCPCVEISGPWNLLTNNIPAEHAAYPTLLPSISLEFIHQ